MVSDTNQCILMCINFEIVSLALSVLDKKIQQTSLNIFLIFSQKIGFNISCKLPPLETICMKCQILFSGKK